MSDDTSIYAVNDSGEACMRVSENVTSSDPTSIYGVNEEGKAAVRVLGADGGGDQHNLGWYATPEALRTAHATAEAGDWAIVGSTDTVWIWDTDTSAWKDSDQKGQVTSVNGQTGDVVLDLLPSQTGNAGRFLTTDGTNGSWSDKPLVNSATGNVNALAIKGTASGINSVSIGQNSSTNANQTAVAVGSNSKVFNISGVSIGGGSEVRGDMGTALGVNTQIQGNYSLAIGLDAAVTATNAIQISAHNYNGGRNVVNPDANTVKIANANGNFEIMSTDGTIPSDRLKNAINKYSTMPTASVDNLGWIVQFTGTTDSTYTHGYLYECVSDGADPATYSWEEVSLGGGGVSDVTVNGTSVVSGGVAAITGMVQNKSNNSNSSLVWLGNGTATGGTLTGSFNIVFGYGANIVNNNSNNNIIVGSQASISGYRSTSNVLVGRGTRITNNDCKNCVLIGTWAFASANNCAIINVGGNDTPDYTNSTPNTLKFCNLNGGYEVISADGTIPAARHAALPSADGTYVLKLVIANGVPTLSWVAE